MSAADAWAACEARELTHRQAGIYLHMLAKPWTGALRIKRIWQHLGLDPDDGVDILDVLEAFELRGIQPGTWFAPRVDPAERKEGAEPERLDDALEDTCQAIRAKRTANGETARRRSGKEER